MRRLALLLLAACPLVAQDAPRAVPVDPALQRDPARDYFQHGRNVYESAKRSTGPTQFDLYRRSIEIFSRYVRDFGGHANAEPAWWYLGQSYYAIGRPEDAKRCYHTLLNRYGKGRYAAAAAYSIAADHFNNRQYALAATLFDKLAAIATDSTDRQRGLYFSGRSYELQGRSRQAIDSYRRLLDDPAPSNPYLNKGRVGLGRLLSEAGKLEDALELLDQAVMAPTTADVRGEAALKAGAVAAKLGDAERSDKYFNLVLRTPGMEEFRPDAQIAMMAARLEQKRYKEVIDIFRSNPLRAEGEREGRRLMLAARAYMMLERNADALPLFREVERIEPPHSPLAFEASYYRLICFYRIEGRHVPDQVDAFLELYRKRHAKDPKIHTALLMKAESLYAKRQPREAADVYRDIDPSLLSEKNRRGMLYQRGRCLADAADPAGALASLTEFIKAYPSDERIPLALAARGRAYAETDQAALARADFEALIQSTDDPELLGLAYLESAEISKAQGDLESMVKLYREFLVKVPQADTASVARANYWAGWGLVKTNHSDEADALLERARELAPETYGKHAGLLLCLVYLAEREPEPLIRELEKAIAQDYASDLPDPLIRWAADQAFNGGSYSEAARFYDLISDDENPEFAPTEVWRYLGKARLESGDPGGALTAIGHVLETERDPAWRADALHDQGRALFQLKKYDEATASVETALALRPEGRIGANIYLLKGDVLMAQDKPSEAVQSYILPVQLMDDGDRILRPKALQRLVAALEKAGKPGEAGQYREELQRKYPGWKED